MKKVISVLSVFTILFGLTACSTAEYVDTPVTAVVTDKNGETVTDKDGNAVTEVVTDKEGNTVYENKESSSAGSESSSAGADSTGTTGAKESTTASGSKKDTTSAATTKKQTTTEKTTQKTTTAKTTTAKPKKRDVTVTVNLPYYNEKKTELTLFYKVDGDKKYTKLETREVILDSNKKTEAFKIEDIKGEVIVYVELKDISATHTDTVIAADKKSGSITPVTGIEIMDGGMV